MLRISSMMPMRFPVRFPTQFPGRHRSDSHRIGPAELALFLCLSALLFFSGCARIVYRTAYKSANTLLYYRIDHYFDLDSSQESYIKARLKEHLGWHRQHELPRYEAALYRLRGAVQRGLRPADVDALNADIRSARIEITQHTKPDIVHFLSTLNAAQISHLESHLPDFNKDLEESVALSPVARRKKLEEQLLDTFKDWIGPLREEQRRMVALAIEKMPDAPPERLRFRKQRGAELVQLLRGQPDQARLSAAMDRWLVNPETSYPPDYRQMLARWDNEMKALFLALDASLTGEQRSAAISRIDGYIRDTQELRDP